MGFGMHTNVVLLVEQSPAMPHPWDDAFGSHGVEVLQAPSETDVRDAVHRPRTAVLVIEACDDVLRYAESIRLLSSSLPVVVLLARSSEDRAIAALRMG